MLRAAWLLLVNFRRALANLLRHVLVRRPPYVWITVDGPLPEFSTRLSFVQRRIQGMQAALSMQLVRSVFRRVEADPRAPGVVLRIQGFSGGWATLMSFHAEVARLRASGKRVVAQLLANDQASYLLACAADSIQTPPSNMVLLPGLRRETVFLKDALARVGVEAQVFAVSPFKAAYEPLTRTDFSDENRAQLTRLLDQRYDAMVQLIATSRKKPVEHVRAVLDQAMLDAPALLAAGLVDSLAYDDQLATSLGTPEVPAPIQPLAVGLRPLRMPYARRVKRTVGVVTVHGAILRGRSRQLPVPLPMLGSQQAGSDSVVDALRQAEKIPWVSALVLHVDSPGGDAFASDLIWREVARVNKTKPVVVCMHNVAASGGYYVAAPAKHIVASPGTITGSIGVIAMRLQLEGLLRLLSLHVGGLQRGKNAGLLSPTQVLTPEERAAFTASIGHTYATFKTVVKNGRGLTEETLEPMAGGRVWTGTEALERKLVDQLGGFPEALEKAQALAGLKVDRDAPYLVLKGSGRDTTLPQPWKDASQTLTAAVTTSHWALLPWELDGL
jgi:protease-4